jgi:hypothetical protein
MPTASNRKQPPKTAVLRQWLAERRPEHIGEAEFAELATALAPISESYLRRLLRDSGVPLTPMVAGVRQGTFDELESSLLNLLREYEGGDPARKLAVRRVVITGKEHAMIAASKAEAGSTKRTEKTEMVLWLATWLENPPLFPDWVRIRRGVLRE